MRGKMYSTTSPSKPWLIPCLLIFITIAASCKMFDGFVQILVPLIHNYCYTCRTKGNFRRGAAWKAAARLWGWWETSVGPHGSSKPLGYHSYCRTPAATQVLQRSNYGADFKYEMRPTSSLYPLGFILISEFGAQGFRAVCNAHFAEIQHLVSCLKWP